MLNRQIEGFFADLQPNDGQPRLRVEVADLFTTGPEDVIGLIFTDGGALITRRPGEEETATSPSPAASQQNFLQYATLESRPSTMTTLGYLTLRAALAAVPEGADTELWVAADGKSAILVASALVKAEAVARKIREDARREGRHHNIVVLLRIQ